VILARVYHARVTGHPTHPAVIGQACLVPPPHLLADDVDGGQAAVRQALADVELRMGACMCGVVCVYACVCVFVYVCVCV
jgi:hypothetical protein